MISESASKAIGVLGEYIHLPQYLRVKWQALRRSPAVYSNGISEFWRDLIEGKLKEGRVVRLENVILTEWFPRVPGLAYRVRYDEEMEQGDTEADRQGQNKYEFKSDYYVQELDSDEKSMVVLSGYGTMRFAPKEDGWLISACDAPPQRYPDTAMAVPLLLKPQDYDHITDRLGKGLVVNLEGVLSRVPGKLGEQVWKGKNIPPVCLVVDSQMLVDVKAEWDGPITCYAWTLFERPAKDGAEYNFAFATHDGTDERRVREAADFLQRYVDKHKGNILTDFDEATPRFDAQIPLGDMMNKQIDATKLSRMMQQMREYMRKPHARTLLLPLRTKGMPVAFGK